MSAPHKGDKKTGPHGEHLIFNGHDWVVDDHHNKKDPEHKHNEKEHH